MNPLQKIRTIPLSNLVLHVIGWIFLAGGMTGQLLQSWLISQAEAQNAAILDVLEGSSLLMTTATIAMMLSVLEYLALPIFVFLLVEGAVLTRHYGKYFLRVLAMALVCQIAYGFRNSGLNPAFSLMLAMILLFFFRQFRKGLGSALIRITAVLGCLLWSLMLQIPHGAAAVVLAAALWLLRSKPYFRTFGGFAVTIACCIFSPAYAAASLSFLVLHFYSGEPGKTFGKAGYLVYPLLLTIAAIAGRMI